MERKQIHKITPAIQSKIAQVAKELPPMAIYRNGRPVYRPTEVKGDDPRIKPEMLKPGHVLNPKALYRINELQYENHTLIMVEGVKKEGEAFIDDYREAIFSQIQHFAAKTRKDNGFFKRIVAKLKKLISKHEK